MLALLLREKLDLVELIKGLLYRKSSPIRKVNTEISSKDKP